MKIERKKGINKIKVVHNKALLAWIIILAVILLGVVIVIMTLDNKNNNTNNHAGNSQTQIANPASIHCIEHGGNLSIRTDDSGGQYGVCVFADKSECEEWKFYRGECSNSTKECSVNSDCVAASCCHASSCTSKENAPECSSVMCTMNCQSGTLDCGQGNCQCINNKCQASFSTGG
jgi:putative hemolysin